MLLRARHTSRYEGARRHPVPDRVLVYPKKLRGFANVQERLELICTVHNISIADCGLCGLVCSAYRVESSGSQRIRPWPRTWVSDGRVSRLLPHRHTAHAEPPRDRRAAFVAFPSFPHSLSFCVRERSSCPSLWVPHNFRIGCFDHGSASEPATDLIPQEAQPFEAFPVTSFDPGCAHG